tara:strand:+ start:1509 stop:1625 length:117 start_codon:yes stop_codon:yes gene_type:complete
MDDKKKHAEPTNGKIASDDPVAGEEMKRIKGSRSRRIG